MSTFNWEEDEKQAGGSTNYLAYAPNGEYKVKLEKVEVKNNDNWKAPMVSFIWQDGEYKYPSNVAHWLYIGNPSFRRVHMRAILMEFGVVKENAQKLIEQAEGDQERPTLVKGYQAMFDRLAQKHPEVTIVVRPQMRDGKPVTSKKGYIWGESDFNNPALQVGKKEKTTTPESNATPIDDLFGGETASETASLPNNEIPF